MRNLSCIVAVALLCMSTAHSQTIFSTHTTLQGFWDYQSNGGACQYMRVSQSNGYLHCIYMLADDSLNPNPSRRTAYAFSTNNGTTWNNFSNVRVPARRSGLQQWMSGSQARHNASQLQVTAIRDQVTKL